MIYKNLGNSGIKVSALSLGTMTFGEPDQTSFMHGAGISEEKSFELMDAAIAAGINFFDTANVYGQEGLTEKIVGRWLHKSGKRDKIVLGTKFRFTMGREPNDRGASRRHIFLAVEESLKRLQTDWIDLYQVHMQDSDTPEEETLSALQDLIRQGKVRYIGCSNYTGYRLMKSLWISDKRNFSSYISLQAQYNLLNRGIEKELIPVCRDQGLGLLCWSPIAGGFLSGKIKRGEDIPKDSRYSVQGERFIKYNTEKNWQILETLKAIAVESNHSCSQIALAWLLHQPQVSSVIIGVRTVEQLEDNLQAVQVKLSSDQLTRLDKVSRLNLEYPYEFIYRITGKL